MHIAAKTASTWEPTAQCLGVVLPLQEGTVRTADGVLISPLTEGDTMHLFLTPDVVEWLRGHLRTAAPQVFDGKTTEAQVAIVATELSGLEPSGVAPEVVLTAYLHALVYRWELTAYGRTQHEPKATLATVQALARTLLNCMGHYTTKPIVQMGPGDAINGTAG